MKQILLTLLTFLPIAAWATSDQLPWQSRRAEGWAWYHDMERPKEEIKLEEPSKDPIIIMQMAKVDLERALATAMLEPTHENVAAYMGMQQRWIKQSALFARVWQQNVLEHPELASQSPTTQYGVQARKEADAAKKRALIKHLSSNHTLLFFYEGKNPYSRAFSRVVQEFSTQHKWTIKSVSVDGVILQNFPNSVRDAGVAEEMDVTIFPALYLVDISTLHATPIAFGMVTTGQIEDNILIQFEEP